MSAHYELNDDGELELQPSGAYLQYLLSLSLKFL